MFAAVRATVYVPAVVGVPLITPVAGFNVNPGGKLPPCEAKAYVAAVLSVLVAATVKLNGWLTKPTALVLLTNVGGASAVVSG